VKENSSAVGKLALQSHNSELLHFRGRKVLFGPQKRFGGGGQR
jgi:hypothetical protein